MRPLLPARHLPSLRFVPNHNMKTMAPHLPRRLPAPAEYPSWLFHTLPLLALLPAAAAVSSRSPNLEPGLPVGHPQFFRLTVLRKGVVHLGFSRVSTIGGEKGRHQHKHSEWGRTLWGAKWRGSPRPGHVCGSSCSRCLCKAGSRAHTHQCPCKHLRRECVREGLQMKVPTPCGRVWLS
jgi:hypothetical protein